MTKGQKKEIEKMIKEAWKIASSFEALCPKSKTDTKKNKFTWGDISLSFDNDKFADEMNELFMKVFEEEDTITETGREDGESEEHNDHVNGVYELLGGLGYAVDADNLETALEKLNEYLEDKHEGTLDDKLDKALESLSEDDDDDDDYIEIVEDDDDDNKDGENDGDDIVKQESVDNEISDVEIQTVLAKLGVNVDNNRLDTVITKLKTVLKEEEETNKASVRKRVSEYVKCEDNGQVEIIDSYIQNNITLYLTKYKKENKFFLVSVPDIYEILPIAAEPKDVNDVNACLLRDSNGRFFTACGKWSECAPLPITDGSAVINFVNNTLKTMNAVGPINWFLYKVYSDEPHSALHTIFKSTNGIITQDVAYSVLSGRITDIKKY